MKNFNFILIIAAIFALFFVSMWYEYSVWQECLSKNSFFYCMRVLSH